MTQTQDRRGLIPRIFRSLAKADAAHRRRVVIEGLDDHQLRDIGLSRNELNEALRGPVRHDRLICRVLMPGRAA